MTAIASSPSEVAAEFFARGPFRSDGAVFSTADWVSAVDATFGWQTRVVEVDGEFLPFTPIENCLGPRLVALPYADYARKLAVPDALAGLLAGLTAEFPQHAISVRVTGAGADFAAAGWQCEPRAADFRLRCTDREEMWRGLAPAFQRGVRKAERDRVAITPSTRLEDLQEFHRMFVAHRAAKFGILSPPWEFFTRLHERFLARGRGFLLGAHARGRLIAGLLVLRHDDVLCYKFGASDPGTLDLRPNNLLFWHLIESALRSGAREIDLGMAWNHDGDAGLRRFKESLGASAEPVSFLTHRPDGYDLPHELAMRQQLRESSQHIVATATRHDELEAAGGRLFGFFN